MTAPKYNDTNAAFPIPMAALGRGMSLRDYFAAKALNGLLSFQGEGSHISYHDAHESAALSYEYADAMLAARQASAHTGSQAGRE